MYELWVMKGNTIYKVGAFATESEAKRKAKTLRNVKETMIHFVKGDK